MKLKPIVDTLLVSVMFLSSLFHKKGPRYLRERLPYNTVLYLGISKFSSKFTPSSLILSAVLITDLDVSLFSFITLFNRYSVAFFWVGQ